MRIFRHSLQYRIFIVFALFILVPALALSAMVSFILLSRTRQSQTAAALDRLADARRELESIELQIHNITAELAQSPDLGQVIIGRQEPGLELRWDYGYVNRTMELLTTLVQSSDFLQSVWIYLDQADMVMTSDNRAVRLEHFIWPDWLEEYRSRQRQSRSLNWTSIRLMPVGSMQPMLRESVPMNRQITFVRALPPFISKARGIIAFTVDEARLAARLGTPQSDAPALDSVMTLMDRRGLVFVSNLPDQIGSLVADGSDLTQVLTDPREAGECETQQNGQLYRTFFLKAADSDWIFTRRYTDAAFSRQLIQIRLWLIVGTLAWLGIGLIIAWLTARRFYQPWRRLVAEIDERGGAQRPQLMNELQLISVAYRRTRERESELFARLETTAPPAWETALADLFDGHERDPAALALIASELPGGQMRCLLLVIDGQKAFRENLSRENQASILRMLRRTAEDVLRRHLTVTVRSMPLDRDRIVLLTSADTASDAAMQVRLPAVWAILQHELAEVYPSSYSLAVGTPAQEPGQLGHSLRAAQIALGERLLTGPGKLHRGLMPSAPTESHSLIDTYPQAEEEAILQALTSGDEDALRAAAAALIRRMRELPGLQPDQILLIFSFLFAGVSRLLRGLAIEGGPLTIRQQYTDLFALETLDDMQSRLLEFLLAVQQRVRQYQNRESTPQDRVMAYIRANYTQELDIQRIAGQTGLSYSYCRAIFKEAFGKTIVEYINELRIEQARKLLLLTAQKLSDIAAQTGFGSEITFRRIFQKQTGLSPVEFRRSGGRIDTSSTCLESDAAQRNSAGEEALSGPDQQF